MIEIQNLKNRAKYLGVKIITDSDIDYPNKLSLIEDRPRVIYQKGSYLEDDNLSIAIVGSRKVTAYGKWASEKFAKELSEIGVTIISGLAHGVDRIAHLAALETGGRTIGVLGNGIDNIYACEDSFDTGFSSSIDVSMVTEQVLGGQIDKIVAAGVACGSVFAGNRR